MEPFSDEYMPDVVRLHVRTGTDEYGTPTYAPPADQDGTPYRARVITRDRSIMTRTGQLVHERGMVLLDGGGDADPPALKNEDLLVLPGGEIPPLIETALIRDAEGVPHHSRASFG